MFEFEKETKRTYRFQEIGTEQIVRTLYVRKTFFETQPKKIKITLEEMK